MQNRFEKHPKTTILVFLAVLFSGLLLLTERFLSFGDKRHLLPVTNRYIRLMENAPGRYIMVVPTDSYLQATDSLEKKRYICRTDNDGFIMPSKVYDSPDIVMVFLGGSTTECGFMAEDNRFPYLAGRLLADETGMKINSYNAGKSSANSLHSLDVLLNKIIPLKPNVVVLMQTVNDLDFLLHENSYYTKNTAKSPIVLIDDLAKPSLKSLWKYIAALTIPHIYQEIRDFLRRDADERLWEGYQAMRTPRRVIDRPSILEQFRTNLMTFTAICRSRGITPVLMTQPSRLIMKPDQAVIHMTQKTALRGIPYTELKEAFDEMNQAVRDVGAENGVQVIDLASRIPQEKDYMYDGVHFNDFGSRAAANIIKSELKPTLVSIKLKQGNPG